MFLLDCTFRDGGYYTNWDFPTEAIVEYLGAMEAAGVDYVELGFRSFESSGFKGACAYSTDQFLRTLPIPPSLKVGVMMNASELTKHALGPTGGVKLLFAPAAQSPVTLVRFACHVHEFEATLPACSWLREMGYEVGINLMQIGLLSQERIEELGAAASTYPLSVLYFADSLGSLDPEQTAMIVRALRKGWKGALGIHTHDNMGRALANTRRAIEAGVTWIDATVTGMGRGPGNAKTEYAIIEFEGHLSRPTNLTPLLSLMRRRFEPMQKEYGWGSNPYYYLAGKYGIHPTYVQEMLADPRYGEAEILSVIDHLREVGGTKFSTAAMEAGRQMYGGAAGGSWAPAELIAGREVLILGAGPALESHRLAVQMYIEKSDPLVIALNTQTVVSADLIDLRVACHPFRLLADCEAYKSLPQPLVAPLSRLPASVRASLGSGNQLDFGLTVQSDRFEFHQMSATIPSSLAVAYALAIATSGSATRILLAGFDGFAPDDPRSVEMDELLACYNVTSSAVPLLAITPTRYKVPVTSVYALTSPAADH
jgi:4-hydroxy 2-oxovalerate aldolase